MLITDLTHFLAPDGSIAPKSGPARRLADYLTAIVAATTSIDPQAEVKCRKRPNRKPCIGKIESHIYPATKQIIWSCPVCGDHGLISQWKGSFWDCSHKSLPH